MKKIFVTGEQLFMHLLTTSLFLHTSTNESFGVDIKLIEEGKMLEGRLILHSRESPITISDSRTLLRFTGALTIDEKKAVLFSGIAERDWEFEYAHIIVAEQRETLVIPISQKEFINLAKQHAENMGILTDENGNILEDGFPIFQNVPKDNNLSSGTFIMRNPESPEYWEVTTMLHNGYFPLMHYERMYQKPTKVCFGKFVSEKTIKLFTDEEVCLLGTEHFFAD